MRLKLLVHGQDPLQIKEKVVNIPNELDFNELRENGRVPKKISGGHFANEDDYFDFIEGYDYRFDI